ncbi:MAG: cupin domain-containing protein [Candidatus Taylorbacteria bacterium]|nr:cupin domain-containing protein [Candidatus Taylorbacteria bacterium]
MDIGEYKKSANLIRDNDIYKVYDLPTLEHLQVSLTELNPQKSTIGHSHDNVDEVYVFIDGLGTMEIGNRTENVKGGDLVLVPRRDFHRVHNKGGNNLNFWTIFEKYERRGK